VSVATVLQLVAGVSMRRLQPGALVRVATLLKLAAAFLMRRLGRVRL
jgi:hypothetical protein